MPTAHRQAKDGLLLAVNVNILATFFNSGFFL